MNGRHRISFLGLCQRALAAALLLAAARLPAAAAETGDGADFLRRLQRMHVGGSFSINWRNVGPRKPGFETQIQNEVYLADMYFGLDGPFVDGVPLGIEFHLPTAGQGRLQLNQFYFNYRRVENLSLQFGKFLVPFARYNELYRPDQYLTVTRPLLYASPDSLDLVVRANSPRPVVSSGYTDIGARASYYPPHKHPLIPAEATFFVVNGLGETNNRQRTFPNTDNLGIASVPGNGSSIDFGHQNNNLADNNNQKAAGGRLVFALGDLRLPWPIPEGAVDLQGMNVGLSAMGGQFDLEAELNYQMYGVDATFDYLGWNFAFEYIWSKDQFKVPTTTSTTNTGLSPGNGGGGLVREHEFIHGYFVQASFPVWRKPPVGRRLTGVLVFNQMFRQGPILDLFLNVSALDSPDGVAYPSLNGIHAGAHRTRTRIDKYTAALNHQLSDHFFLKGEYSYWVMGRSSTRTETSLGLVDIYQGAISLVMAF